MAEVQRMIVAREYETIYVLKPDSGKEASERISDRVRDVITKQRGSLTRVENWGFRKLAYPVRKHSRGVYVYLKYIGDGALVSELERSLRLQDSVLKYQTVKLGEGPGAVETKPEDVQFEHMEAMVEDGTEESVARSLGLEGGRLEDRSDSGRDGPSELDDDEDDFIPGAKAAAAAAAAAAAPDADAAERKPQSDD
jgi:small subunit ribosomal protein S6